MANLADSIVFGDLTVTRDQLVKGSLTVEGLLSLTGNLTVSGTISGNGSGLTSLNASNLSTGTVATARLPAAALVGDTTYGAGTGLTLSGTTFNIANPFNPAGTYASLRAQATTKADVGLSLVDNLSAASIRAGTTKADVGLSLVSNIASTSASTASTVVQRNGSGDIQARLFRSEYDTTNPTIGYIMTQIDTATNNYLRPSTPAQLKAGLAIGVGDVSGLSDAATTTVATIRAGTTAANVGLGSVRNVASYSQAEANAQFLGIAAKAADSNLLDGIDSGGFLRSNATDYLTATLYTRGDLVAETAYRNRGIFGTYDSNKTQHIWSMGTAYRNSSTGVNFGNLYGLAYKHTNNTTGGTMAGGHQAVWCQNGSPKVAMGTNLWTSGIVYGADFTATSDRRVKSDLKEIPGALDKILNLTGYTYQMKGLEKGVRRMGLIAQDVLGYFPEAVHGSEESQYSLSYGSLVAAVVMGMKEQQAIIDDQKETIADLLRRVANLES